MLNSFDRLERFFSKRKSSAVTEEKRPSESRTITEIPQFPSPSFIRPKASRMAARQEARNLQSLPHSASESELGEPEGLESNRNDKPPRLTLLPMRSLSLLSPNGTFTANKLEGYGRSTTETRAGAASGLFESQAVEIPIKERSSRKCKSRASLRIVIPSNTIDTPPPSDSDAAASVPFLKRLPPIPQTAPPTPRYSLNSSSPERQGPRYSKSADTLSTETSRTSQSLQSQFPKSSMSSMPHRSESQSSKGDLSQASLSGSTLKEPEFQNFWELSDEDVAESPPESPILPATENDIFSFPSISLAFPPPQPSQPSLLTLTPQRPSGPATAAAFEAARIAARYDFDTIYVVNLWPDDGGAGSHTDIELGQTPNSKPQAMGRLLAAHGLHHVSSPLQISSTFHNTVLQTEGWIEYCNVDARPQDLARGYACSFYQGHFDDGKLAPAKFQQSEVRLPEAIDRGIVFAAYRKPRSGRDKLGATLKPESLGNLHDQAEALVQMLMDVHLTNRLRQPQLSNRVSDGIGPIPIPNIESS